MNWPAAYDGVLGILPGILGQELPLQELRRSVDVTGSSANANAMHSLRVGSSVRVVEDFFSIGNVKLKQGPKTFVFTTFYQMVNREAVLVCFWMFSAPRM